MDIQYLLWLQGLRESSPAFVRAFFGFLGSEVAMVVSLLVPCVVYWCLDKASGVYAMLSYAGSSLVNQALKNTVCCYRPWVRDARVHPVPGAQKGATGYSFPSAHSQGSTSMLFGIGWSQRDRRRWPLVAGLSFAALVMFSRNFLGVHAPQDVLVGCAEGIACVLLVERLLAWVAEDPQRDRLVLAWGIAATLVFLAYTTLKPYPRDYVDGKLLVDPAEMLVDCYKIAGAVLGILGGWFVERRWVGFTTEGVTLRSGALRMLVGALIALVAYVPVGHALMDVVGVYAGQLVRHLLTFGLIAAGIPALFTRLERRLAPSPESPAGAAPQR